MAERMNNSSKAFVGSFTFGASIRSIVGKWKLVSFIREEVATGTKIKLLGEDPKGFIIYTNYGRMMAVLARGASRHLRNDEFPGDYLEHVIAYSGLYQIEGNKVIHDVDISWVESAMQTKLTRFFNLEDDRLTLNTALDENSPPGKDVTDALVFQREPGW